MLSVEHYPSQYVAAKYAAKSYADILLGSCDSITEIVPHYLGNFPYYQGHLQCYNFLYFLFYGWFMPNLKRGALSNV